MSLIPEGKTRTVVYGGVAVGLVVVAAIIYFMSRGSSTPDAATQAALERNKAIQANMEPGQPPPPDLPVEQRAPRGAVRTK